MMFTKISFAVLILTSPALSADYLSIVKIHGQMKQMSQQQAAETAKTKQKQQQQQTKNATSAEQAQMEAILSGKDATATKKVIQQEKPKPRTSLTPPIPTLQQQRANEAYERCMQVYKSYLTTPQQPQPSTALRTGQIYGGMYTSQPQQLQQTQQEQELLKQEEEQRLMQEQELTKAREQQELLFKEKALEQQRLEEEQLLLKEKALEQQQQAQEQLLLKEKLMQEQQLMSQPQSPMVY